MSCSGVLKYTRVAVLIDWANGVYEPLRASPVTRLTAGDFRGGEGQNRSNVSVFLFFFEYFFPLSKAAGSGR